GELNSNGKNHNNQPRGANGTNHRIHLPRFRQLVLNPGHNTTGMITPKRMERKISRPSVGAMTAGSRLAVFLKFSRRGDAPAKIGGWLRASKTARIARRRGVCSKSARSAHRVRFAAAVCNRSQCSTVRRSHL